jgi:hypothetical protein
MLNNNIVETLFQRVTAPKLEQELGERSLDDFKTQRFERDFLLGILLHLLRERKKGHKQDVYRAWLLLTCIFTIATLLVLAVVSYESFWTTPTVTSVAPDGLPVHFAEQAPLFPVPGMVMLAVVAGLLIVLCTLTFGRLRGTSAMEAEEEIVSNYRSLLAENERLHYRQTGFK